MRYTTRSSLRTTLFRNKVEIIRNVPCAGYKAEQQPSNAVQNLGMLSN